MDDRLERRRAQWAASARAWRAAHPDRAKAAAETYREKHRPQIAARARAAYRQNQAAREKRLLHRKTYQPVANDRHAERLHDPEYRAQKLADSFWYYWRQKFGGVIPPDVEQLLRDTREIKASLGVIPLDSAAVVGVK